MGPLNRLVLRSASHHWRTNVAVCLGVAAAVAVLGGALLVGDSVRGSLRDLALSRLGRASSVVSSAGFFRESLAAGLGPPGASAPLISTTGIVTHEPSGRRASNVLVYGVDERFWRFHGLPPRDGVFVSPALLAELNAMDGDVLLTRLQRPSEIPLESLFSQKEDIARTVRLTLSAVLPRDQLGEFSVQPQQAEVRAVFAPLQRLQRDLEVRDQVNTLVVSDTLPEADAQRALNAAVTLEDIGVKVGMSADATMVTLDSTGGVIGEALERSAREAGRALGLAPVPLFTYLANTIRVRDREVPYSLVTGLDLRAVADLERPAGPSGRIAQSRPGTLADSQASNRPSLGRPLPSSGSLVLNEWTARELNAAIGDPAELEYYLWDPAGGLRTDRAAFTVVSVVPMVGLAADRRLAPEYPGITEADSLADWDPPFPIDLARVRPQDERYWRDHRATPKAFVDYGRARDLWSTRYGSLTGLRFTIPKGQDPAAVAARLATRLQETITPASQGLVLIPSRRLAVAASAGATNFGEYFTYFSFFIVVSALLLTVLFFRLGVEQRLRQVGVLRATGYTSAHIRRLLLTEAAIVAAIGSLLGVAGAVGYAHAIVFGLRTWWHGAVGTTLLAVHVTPLSLLAGIFGGMLAALACVLLSLRSVARRSPRALLGAYSLDDAASGAGLASGGRRGRMAGVAVVAGFSLLTLGFVSRAAQAGAFFGGGAALLIGSLLSLSAWLRSRDRRPISGHGFWAVSRLGFRGAAFRPGRSVLSAALIAAAAFIIVSVDAFRRGGEGLTHDPKAGTGGYVLLARSEVPLVHNPNEPAGRDALLLRAPELSRTTFARFRMRPGDDASCLNLYRPANPTIVAPEAAFIKAARFSFSGSLAGTPEERDNPWLLLGRSFPDGAVPVVADATSLQYVLHASLGDTMTIDVGATAPLTLRFVAALRDSVLQGELVMGEEQFIRLFPGHQGFRFFLVDAPDTRDAADAGRLAGIVEKELQPFGVDAVSTAERLEAFHRVENTYLSTFQALGGLGLLLGTIGLATVMFRNVLERRRELALLRAVGYNARHVTTMILAETMFLLVCGLAAGAGCAIIAIAPAWLGRGGSAPGAGLGLLLVAVVLAGILSAAAATRAALSGQLLESLRAE